MSGGAPDRRREFRELRELRDFRGRRWLGVALRGAHLIAVIEFSAVVLHPGPAAAAPYAGSAVLVSGVLMWLLDLWHRPQHLVEGAGLSLLVKLALVAAMVAAPSLRVPLFWIIVAWSALFAHAPARFRNARLLRKGG